MSLMPANGFLSHLLNLNKTLLVGLLSTTVLQLPALAVQPSHSVDIAYNLYELPSAQAAQRTLAEEASVFWEQKPLREGLQELAQNFAITIWIDRRVDPAMRIDLRVKATQTNRSLGELLSRIAARAGCEAGLIENVVYIGPTGEVAKLQRAAVALHNRMTQASQSSMAQLRGLKWPELATPTDLMKGIGESWQTHVEASLPHDLMHSGQLERPCTLATQLTIAAGGFELEPVLTEQGEIHLTPLLDQTTWSCTYQLSSLNAERITPAELNRLRALHRPSSLTVRGKQCVVTGPAEFHVALLRPQGRQKPKLDLDRQRWSYEVKNIAAGAVIDNLAESIGFEVNWDSRISRDQQAALISLVVENASLDQLLTAFAQASGFAVDRKELRVLIQPKR